MQAMNYGQLRQHIINNLSKIMSHREASSESKYWLVDGLGYSMSWIISNSNLQVTINDMKKVCHWLTRRKRYEPWSYILGWSWFLNRRYYINKNTLIPRPETELLVDIALKIGKRLNINRICDIGTGSGIIAISLALATNWHVTATDISSDALSVAVLNAKTLKAKNIDFCNCDLLSKITDPIGLIISNPPYVGLMDEPLLQKELFYEPRIALFSGYDGLSTIKRLIIQAKQRSAHGCIIEIGSGQGEILKKIARSIGWHQVDIYNDFNGHNRVLVLI